MSWTKLITAAFVAAVSIAVIGATPVRASDGASATGGFTYTEFNSAGLRTWVGSLSANGWLDDAHGVVHLNFDPLMNAVGDVSCLYVNGNDAYLSGTWREASKGNVLPYFELHVVDNGKDDAFRSSSSIFLYTGSSHCGADGVGSAPVPISEGEIRVTGP